MTSDLIYRQKTGCSPSFTFLLNVPFHHLSKKIL
jgi:hypothetical protein